MPFYERFPWHFWNKWFFGKIMQYQEFRTSERSCRSRKILKNYYLDAKIGFDTPRTGSFDFPIWTRPSFSFSYTDPDLGGWLRRARYHLCEPKHRWVMELWNATRKSLWLLVLKKTFSLWPMMWDNWKADCGALQLLQSCCCSKGSTQLPPGTTSSTTLLESSPFFRQKRAP